MGGYFKKELDDLSHKFGFIKEVRGQGLMLGVDIDFPCKHFVTEAMAEGMLINVTHETVVRMRPPYIITEREVDRAIRGLSKIFRKASRTYTKSAS